jgi:hypothetical protein
MALRHKRAGSAAGAVMTNEQMRRQAFVDRLDGFIIEAERHAAAAYADVELGDFSAWWLLSVRLNQARAKFVDAR